MDIIEKHINDPNWSEVVRLYSGLFDEQEEREGFIIDLADTNISLAAECKTNSFLEEQALNKQLVCLAKDKAIDFNNFDLSALAFIALIELNENGHIVSIISKIKIPKKTHKSFIQRFIDNADKEHLLLFIDIVINNDTKQNKQIFDWTFQSLGNLKSFEVYFEEEKYISSFLKKLGKNEYRSQLLLSIYKAYVLCAFKINYPQKKIEELIVFLSKSRKIDKGQFQVIEKLETVYKLNNETISLSVEELENKAKEREKQRIEYSDNIKKSILGKIVKCRLKKVEKAKSGKIDKVPVTILDIERPVRGQCYIRVADFKNIDLHKTGEMVNAKVLEIKPNQGETLLTLINDE